MIKVCMKDLVGDKSLYSIAKNCGLSYSYVHSLVDGKTEIKSMKFDILEKLCNELNCDISDMLKIDKK